MEEIQLESLPVKIHLKRSTRARRTRMMIRPSGLVQVVAPQRQSQKTILNFIEEHKDWILQTLKNLKPRTSKKIWPDKFEDGAQLFYQGQYVPLSVTTGTHIKISYLNFCFILETPNPNPTYSQIKKAFVGWYKVEFEKQLNQLLSLHAPKITKKATAIRIGRFRSRWGSCRSDGLVQLNFHLNFVPLKCLEYVLVHELCHLIEMNHSKAFWNSVEKLLPDYKVQRKLLRDYSDLLEPKFL